MPKSLGFTKNLLTKLKLKLKAPKISDSKRSKFIFVVSKLAAPNSRSIINVSNSFKEEKVKNLPTSVKKSKNVSNREKDIQRFNAAALAAAQINNKDFLITRSCKRKKNKKTYLAY